MALIFRFNETYGRMNLFMKNLIAAISGRADMLLIEFGFTNLLHYFHEPLRFHGQVKIRKPKGCSHGGKGGNCLPKYLKYLC